MFAACTCTVKYLSGRTWMVFNIWLLFVSHTMHAHDLYCALVPICRSEVHTSIHADCGKRWNLFPRATWLVAHEVLSSIWVLCRTGPCILAKMFQIGFSGCMGYIAICAINACMHGTQLWTSPSPGIPALESWIHMSHIHHSEFVWFTTCKSHIAFVVMHGPCRYAGMPHALYRSIWPFNPVRSIHSAGGWGSMEVAAQKGTVDSATTLGLLL
jgi:hypothetical protein